MSSFGSRVSASGSPAAADAPHGVTNLGLVDLPAADLVAHLIGCNGRASDFVDAALVLAARERRLAEAEARVRAADAAAARLANEIAALGCRAAEAAAQIHQAAEREALLRAEIREWQRRATEAEVGARDGVPGPSSLMLSTAAALPAEHGTATDVVVDLAGHDDAEEANNNRDQAAEDGRGEEVPVPMPLLVVVSAKRKEFAVSSEDKGTDEDDDGRTTRRTKKVKPLGGRCRPTSQNAVPEPVPIAIVRDEAEAEEEEEGGDDLPEASLVIGGGDVTEERTRTDDGEPAETETGGILDTEASPAAANAIHIHSGASGGRGGSTARRNNNVKYSYYKMVFRALKENEMKLALAAAHANNEPAAATAFASQPNLMCALCRNLYTKSRSVAVEDGPDDKDEPQQ